MAYKTLDDLGVEFLEPGKHYTGSRQMGVMREKTGFWMMVFHGEDVLEGHSAALGVAWSTNLIDWSVA